MSNFRFYPQHACVGMLLPALFISSFAQAQSSEPALPAVVVTAARIEQPQTDAIAHTTIITAADIKNAQSRDLISILQREAGLQFTQSGGIGQPSSLFMRGANASQTLILIDGVPVHREGFAAAPALEHILPSQIDRIEIVRGNVSAIYGSAAIGGVIQIFTKQGEQGNAANVALETGSFGTVYSNAGLSGKVDRTRYAVSITRYSTDGLSVSDKSIYPNENRDRDGYGNSSISGNIAQELIKGHEVGIRFYGNEGKAKYDGAGYGYPTDIAFGESKSQSFSLYSKNQFTQQWLSTLNLSQTRLSDVNVALSTDPYGYPFDSRDKGRSNLVQWQNLFTLSPTLSLNAGVETGQDKFDTANVTSSASTHNLYSRNRTSIYSGLNAKFDVHQWQVNVRRDQIGEAGGDTTGYLGYGYHLTPAFKLTASASTAFNAPTLAQLFDPANGNAQLKSEHSRSYELGGQYSVDTTLIRAVLFTTKTENQFATDPNNCSFFSCPSYNLKSGSNEGLEISASGKWMGTALRGSLTLQDPMEADTGKSLIRRAKVLGALSASRAIGPWLLGADVNFAGRRPDLDFSTWPSATPKTLGAYWLANLTARYQLNREWSLNGRIQNLLDERYQTSYGYNSMPRGVFVGINWQR